MPGTSADSTVNVSSGGDTGHQQQQQATTIAYANVSTAEQIVNVLYYGSSVVITE